MLDSWESLKDIWSQPDAVVWVDLEDPTPGDLHSLDAIIDLDDDTLEECLTGEPRPRIDEGADYLMVIAYGVRAPEGQTELESRKLAIFRGQRFLVTIHSQPSRSVSALKQRCEKNPTAVLGRGTDHMLYRLIDGMVDRYLELITQYERELDDFEELSFDPNADGSLLQESRRLRHHFIELRRLVTAQRALVDPLAEGEYDDVSEELSRKFRTVRNHLTHASDQATGLQERLAGAVQNYNTTVASRTNDIMQTLTVFTAVMLPMSFLAGVYGMNLPVWPAGDSPLSFWFVIGLMVVSGGAMLALFRRLRWI